MSPQQQGLFKMKQFKKAFKFGKEHLILIIMYLLIIGLSLYVLVLYTNYLADFQDALGFALYDEYSIMANAEGLEEQMHGMIVYGILGAVFLIVNYIIWKYLGWMLVLKEKFNTKKFGKFALLNLIYGAIAIPISVILLLFASTQISSLVIWATETFTNLAQLLTFFIPIYVFILFPIFLYLLNIGNILQYNFFKEKKFVSKTLEKIGNLKKLYIHYVLASVVFVLLLSLTMFLANAYINAAVFIVFLGWQLKYLIEIIK